MSTRRQTPKRTAKRDVAKSKEREHLGFTTRREAEVAEKTELLGEDGLMAPFSTRREGKNYMMTENVLTKLTQNLSSD